MSRVSVLIGGDLVPQGCNLAYFRAGDAVGIFNDLLEEFRNADLSIVNLECPLIAENTPILKSGPIIGVEGECVFALKNASIDVVNLANNHILDHGQAGLSNTIELCKKAGIAYVGAGENLAEARRILIRKIGELRLAIMSVAEHEFSIATKDKWGANALDIIDYVRNIQEHKHEWDYLIVLLHGGNEYYPYPSPRIRDTCRFMIEQGANAVICQHSHCPGCCETYRGNHIVYGQGNLIFDESPNRNKSKTWNEGFLVRLNIQDDCSSTMKVIPYIQSDKIPGARRMDSNQQDLFLQELKERSCDIQKDGAVESQWSKFCAGKKHEYLRLLLLPDSRLLGYLNRKCHLADKLSSRKKHRLLLALIRCESHREVLETILQ